MPARLDGAARLVEVVVDVLSGEVVVVVDMGMVDVEVVVDMFLLFEPASPFWS